MTIRAASRPIPKPERSSYAKRFILPQLGGGLGFVPDDDDYEEVIKTSRVALSVTKRQRQTMNYCPSQRMRQG